MNARASKSQGKKKDQESNRFTLLKLQHERLLLKHDPIMDFSAPKYSNFEKQPSYANKDDNSPMEEDIVLEDSNVTQDILIVEDSTIVVNEKKEFIQDSEVKDVSMEEQALLVSSFEENNIQKFVLKRFQVSMMFPLKRYNILLI